MLLLVIEDLRNKGCRYEMYTFWGEITTLLVFFLLTACSIEKYAQSKSDATLCNGKLFKATSFWFQQAMMQEITITVLFWSFLYFIATDLKNMSWQMIKEKLYYDIVLDTDNYNHSIPIVLLMIEFGVNNIQFSWKHLAIHILSNVAYMVLHVTCPDPGTKKCTQASTGSMTLKDRQSSRTLHSLSRSCSSS